MGNNRKKEIAESVNTFINELVARVSLLKDSVLSFDRNGKNYGKLINIIDIYTTIAPSKLIEEDIFYFKKEDISELLILSGVSDDDVKDILKKYDKYLNDYNYATSKTKVKEASEYFAKILKYIKDFISDYESKSDSLITFQEETIAKYEKYINLFSQKDFSYLFVDNDELNKVFREASISETDQGHIYEYIVEKNVLYCKRNSADIDLDNKINNLSKSYLTKGNIALDATLKSIEVINEVDIDLIPSLAYGISEANNLDKNLVQNTIACLYINSLYKEYKKCDNESDKKKYMETIVELLVFIKDIPYEIETIARDLVTANSEIYNYYVNENNVDPVTLIEDNIETIKSKYNTSVNSAIDLKKIAILKIISDTLDTIDVNRDAKEYDKECSILKECVGQIYFYDHKKESSTSRRIN